MAQDLMDFAKALNGLRNFVLWQSPSLKMPEVRLEFEDDHQFFEFYSAMCASAIQSIAFFGSASPLTCKNGNGHAMFTMELVGVKITVQSKQRGVLYGSTVQPARL